MEFQSLPAPLLSLLLAAITLACPSPSSRGQDGDDNGAAAAKIDLADLPSPPADLAALIEQGDVSFLVGRRTDRAQSQSQNRAVAKMGAETHYQLGFDYRCQSRWRINRSSGKRFLSISVTYQRIKLTRSHEVWFRKQPNSSGFWSNKLVLHEFDHVRLSSDPSIEKRFIETLRENRLISEELEANTKVTESLVRSVIDRHAHEIFDEMIDLIDIRYQELDRQTDHGLRPLPENSSLSQWLR